MRVRQDPLAGLGGRVRFGRAAASSITDRPAYTASSLPRAFQTRIDPATILLDVAVGGEPHPKQRPRHTMAKLDDHGNLIQGHTYTPAATREAEEMLRWVFLAARVNKRLTPGPVGVLAFFRTGRSQADADNLLKTVLDALQATVIDNDQQVSECHVHLLRACTEPATELLVWSTARRVPGT